MLENREFEHDAEEPSEWLGDPGMMPEKQMKSRRFVGKDKRKSDMMPKNRGFGHDAEEPSEWLEDSGTMPESH